MNNYTTNIEKKNEIKFYKYVKYQNLIKNMTNSTSTNLKRLKR